MAASPVKGDWKHLRGSSKEGQPSSPESSLTWCLAHLHKPGSGPERQADSGGGKDMDKRHRASQWRALVAIRTQHIKGGREGIGRFRGQGGLRPLLGLLRQPDSSRKTLDLALSILANCCTDSDSRVEVRKLGGIEIVVDIMKKNVAFETVQNRAARALGNLAMDPESSALIHSAGGVPLLLLCVSLSSAPSSPTAAPPTDSCPKLECAQSAARALLYLSDTPSNRLALLTQGALSALAPLTAPEHPPGLRGAGLRALHELTRGCGVEGAREVSRSGVLAQLGAMATGDQGKPFEELALKTLANICSQGCLRPLVGSLGVIPKFVEEVKKDPLKSGVFLRALCLCCKEAVNRAKVKDCGGLEVLVGFLSAHQSHPLSKLTILACVDFVFDESAMEQLQELGLVPLLVSRLVKLTRGEEQAAERPDAGPSSSPTPAELLHSPGGESFDFPPPEGYRREEAGREQGSASFLSLRSWLLSEGLISSEGDLLDSSGVDGDWGSPQAPPPSSPQTSSPNPYSSSSLKNSSSSSSSSSSSGSAVSASLKKPAQPSSDPQPPRAPAPQAQITPPPNKTGQAPVSPTKFSSPQKKRRAPSQAGLAQVTLEAPPPAPRPAAAYHHPYHPEPWTAESPVLLLLSRFSHAGDPSGALVSPGVVAGLLLYLTQHPDPSGRCLRLLARLSCNPTCLQALLRTGPAALIRHHLCQGGGGGGEKQRGRVRAKVKQLGVSLLNNLRVQCESGFGSGVVAHVMLSGSESDRMNCALSLPFISSNRPLLRRLLLDGGGLQLALQPLSCAAIGPPDAPHSADCQRLLSDFLSPPHPGPAPPPHSLYCSLLTGCLSALTAGGGPTGSGGAAPEPPPPPPPPPKRPRLAGVCPYAAAGFDLVLLLDDGTRVPYFRALLRGGFGEARSNAEEVIRIRDVGAGELVPVLHYLHGCRLGGGAPGGGGGGGAACPALEAPRRDWPPAPGAAFRDTALGELLVGAGRFLVGRLQREAEALCLSLLLSGSGPPPPATPNATPTTPVDHAAPKTEPDRPPTPEQKPDPDLTAQIQKLNSSLQQTQIKKAEKRGAAPDRNAVRRAVSAPRAAGGKPPPPAPPAAGGEALAALLPQLYWFSQRYSYPALGRGCLVLLLGNRRRPPPFPSAAAAGECLRTLANQADCTEGLKKALGGGAAGARGGAPAGGGGGGAGAF
ncbi:unnamed protein product [Menidia menidia]|uniref:(Atlantic silverside) hypothetical protein n=1 Tax=Menidia menidia TaxID=238744 RepID=A0A8S4AQL9_9TELE|nr:unnamed protein product [Menidia menidia]